MAAVSELARYRSVDAVPDTSREQTFFAQYEGYYNAFNIVWPFYKMLTEVVHERCEPRDGARSAVIEFHSHVVRLAYAQYPQKLEVAIACGPPLFDYFHQLLTHDPKPISIEGFLYYMSYQNGGGVDIDALVERLIEANQTELNKNNPVPLFLAIQSVKFFTHGCTPEHLATRVFQIMKPSHEKIFYLLAPAFFDAVAKASPLPRNRIDHQEDRECCSCRFM